MDDSNGMGPSSASASASASTAAPGAVGAPVPQDAAAAPEMVLQPNASSRSSLTPSPSAPAPQAAAAAAAGLGDHHSSPASSASSSTTNTHTHSNTTTGSSPLYWSSFRPGSGASAAAPGSSAGVSASSPGATQAPAASNAATPSVANGPWSRSGRVGFRSRSNTIPWNPRLLRPMASPLTAVSLRQSSPSTPTSLLPSLAGPPSAASSLLHSNNSLFSDSLAPTGFFDSAMASAAPASVLQTGFESFVLDKSTDIWSREYVPRGASFASTAAGSDVVSAAAAASSGGSNNGVSSGRRPHASSISESLLSYLNGASGANPNLPLDSVDPSSSAAALVSLSQTHTGNGSGSGNSNSGNDYGASLLGATSTAAPFALPDLTSSASAGNPVAAAAGGSHSSLSSLSTSNLRSSLAAAANSTSSASGMAAPKQKLTSFGPSFSSYGGNGGAAGFADPNAAAHLATARLNGSAGMSSNNHARASRRRSQSLSAMRKTNANNGMGHSISSGFYTSNFLPFNHAATISEKPLGHKRNCSVDRMSSASSSTTGATTPLATAAPSSNSNPLTAPTAAATAAATTPSSNAESSNPSARTSTESAGSGWSGIGDATIENLTQAEPTHALWVGNLPAGISSTTVGAAFAPYGNISNVRMLSHKHSAFINFDTVQNAKHALEELNGRTLFSESDPVCIGFAKVASAPSENVHVSLESINKAFSNVSLVPSLSEVRNDILSVVRDFGYSQLSDCVQMLDKACKLVDFAAQIPSVSKAFSSRRLNAPKLRQVRKRIDNGLCTQEEVEDIAISWLDEVSDLSSDHLGNTVVQKLFDYCSDPVKEMMLERIAPHLAQIGIHKNGTWAAQKIVDVASTEKQMLLIAEHVQPYIPLLFADPFGNYVVQACLKFKPPMNDFVFETIMSQFWVIAQSRYGSRAVRACLDSKDASSTHRALVSATIVVYADHLAMNGNGTLLLNYLLENKPLPNVPNLLASRFVQDIVRMCTHRLASTTLLKVIAHAQEDSQAGSIIVRALLQHNAKGLPLERVMADQSYGPAFLLKLLMSDNLPESDRMILFAAIREQFQFQKEHMSSEAKKLFEYCCSAGSGSSEP
ncbi:hypothetical protein SJAG_16457 [Schizosaccharomyces japonicus yFS275]|uniref:RNA-binding protein n=1 Tax=Schizosaccharomyces japonicus (strain yFS275 / FY16936) TaxID=402676 RepID=T0S149_SCHJY|nr:hypothetical protein SJAG_16457 [Schizosaccharomyces japonicus yFS275]EQC53037.1 hypothetical protein SJAG_16457 [Schizosaccharomyces japonicus yFS275]